MSTSKTAFVCASILAGAVLWRPDAQADPPKPLRPQDVAIPVNEAALARQYEALATMPSVEVAYNKFGLLRRIEGRTGIVLKNRGENLKEGDSAREILEQIGPLFLATGAESLSVKANYLTYGNTRVIKLQQSIEDIPVVNGFVVLAVDSANGTVKDVESYFVPDRELPRAPTITAEKASGLAAEYLQGAGWAEPKSVELHGEPTLGYFGGFKEPETPSLVWVIRLSYLTPAQGSYPPSVEGSSISRTVLIDATDGTFRGFSGGSMASINRSVYTASNSRPTVGGFPSGLQFMFGEGGSTTDSIAQNAYQNVGRSYNAWLSMFAEEIGPVGIAVHWGTNELNAASEFANGKHWLAFGDGGTETGGSAHIPSGNSLDMVAHEYGHGVVAKHMVHSFLNEESANLNEAFSDFSSVLVDVHTRSNSVAPATWELHETYATQPTRARVS